MSRKYFIKSLFYIALLYFGATTPLTAQTATYYHPSLAGRTKANGRAYNPNAMTAASNNYRLGTRVRVTNRRTGKSVVVTITDRCGNCSIDLSRAAFQRIAPLKQGRVPVRVTRI
jgi:rare lipoprotein A